MQLIIINHTIGAGILLVSYRVVVDVVCDFEARRRIHLRYGAIRAARVLSAVLATYCCLGSVRGTEHFVFDMHILAYLICFMCEASYLGRYLDVLDPIGLTLQDSQPPTDVQQ